MTDFKQIIGRGTRVRDDYELYFTILDYTGSAIFADPEFDDEPRPYYRREINNNGRCYWRNCKRPLLRNENILLRQIKRSLSKDNADKEE